MDMGGAISGEIYHETVMTERAGRGEGVELIRRRGVAGVRGRGG